MARDRSITAVTETFVDAFVDYRPSVVWLSHGLQRQSLKICSSCDQWHPQVCKQTDAVELHRFDVPEPGKYKLITDSPLSERYHISH